MADGVKLAAHVTAGSGITTATVVELRDDVLVCDVEGEPTQCAVLCSAQSPPTFHEGDEVLVWSPEGAGGPVVLGRVGQPGPPDDATMPEELVIEAGRKLTLRVGEGSITIREDGKVLIKGRDLVSHAKRLNRIKGGSVAIN